MTLTATASAVSMAVKGVAAGAASVPTATTLTVAVVSLPKTSSGIWGTVVGAMIGSCLTIFSSLLIFYIQQRGKDGKAKVALLEKRRKVIRFVAEQTREYFLAAATLAHDADKKKEVGGIDFPQMTYDTSLLSTMRPQVLDLFGWDLTREMEIVVLKFEELNEIRRIGKTQLVGAQNQERLELNLEKERAFDRMIEVLRMLKSRRHAFIGALEKAAVEHGILDSVQGLIDSEKSRVD